MSASRYANGARRRALAARVRAVGDPCWMCGLPIRYDAPAGHPLSLELDELVPVSKGGSPTDPDNVAPAHRCCNQWRSDRSVATVRAMRDEALRRFGRWTTPQGFCEAVRALKRGRGPTTPVRHPKRSSGLL